MSFQRRLRALGFPKCETFDASDAAQLHALMCWLEDTKIRLFKIADRSGLRSSPFPSPAAERYLADVGCPKGLSNAATAEWLINRAVSLEFRDFIDSAGEEEDPSKKGTAAAAVPPHPQQQQATTVGEFAKVIESITDFSSREWKEAASKLAMVVGAEFPNDAVSQVAVVRAIANVIHRRFSTSAVASTKPPNEGEPPAKQQAAASSSERSPDPLAEFPLGMDGLSDELTKRAMAVLRLLYLSDLKELQTRINELLAAVQALTANPKTNTALGVVGF